VRAHRHIRACDAARTDKPENIVACFAVSLARAVLNTTTVKCMLQSICCQRLRVARLTRLHFPLLLLAANFNAMY